MRLDDIFENSGYEPDLDIPDIEVGDLPESTEIKQSNIWDTSRKAWNAIQTEKPRCDMKQGRIVIKPKYGLLTICKFRRSIKGPTLLDIKTDKSKIAFFAEQMINLIHDLLGDNLDKQLYAMITPPPRRHKEGNFAQAVAKIIADHFNINFYSNCLHAKNHCRYHAKFEVIEMPKEPVVLVFDDILTSGQTMLSTVNELRDYGKSYICFAGISNEL